MLCLTTASTIASNYHCNAILSHTWAWTSMHALLDNCQCHYHCNGILSHSRAWNLHAPYTIQDTSYPVHRNSTKGLCMLLQVSMPKLTARHSGPQWKEPVRLLLYWVCIYVLSIASPPDVLTYNRFRSGEAWGQGYIYMEGNVHCRTPPMHIATTIYVADSTLWPRILL